MRKFLFLSIIGTFSFVVLSILKPGIFIQLFEVDERQDLHFYQISMLIVIFIMAVVLSVLPRKKLITKIKRKSDIESLSWQDFEILTKQFYEKRGFKSSLAGGGGADDGVDVILKRGRKTWIVQCKHWKSKKVGIPIVREMYGNMIHKNADGVKIICTSGFTKGCYDFAKGKPIELIDIKKLSEEMGV